MTTWKPERTLEEVHRIISAPGSMHEMEDCLVDGRMQRCYRNAWPSLRIFWLWAVQEHRDREYVVYEGHRLTFGEVYHQSVKAAHVFGTVYGIQKGDRVGICCRNYPEFMISFWAIMLLGAVSVQVNAWLPLPTLQHCLTITECKLIILDSERADRVEPVAQKLLDRSGVSGFLVIRPNEGRGRWKGMKGWAVVMRENQTLPASPPPVEPILPEDNATILFTSGTTGKPKGVLSTHRMVVTNALNTLVASRRAALRRGESILPAPRPEPRKSILICVPLFHVTAECIMLGSTMAGIKMVFMRKWNPKEAVRLIKEENVGSAGGVPAIVMDLIESGNSDLPLETLSFGGAPTPKSLPDGAARTYPGITLSQGYGLTETSGVITTLIGEDLLARPSSCGFPCPINDVCIVRNGKVVPPGEVGELWVKGANIMKGYWADPKATREVLTADGWFKTGDMASKDHEGFVYIRDRLKDIIIRGGENIDSVAVENAIYADDRIHEVAAVGIPHGRLGEQVAAIVHPKLRFRGRVTADSIIAVAAKSLPRFAVPVLVIVRDEPLERTPTGKIIKGTLRELARSVWESEQSKESPRSLL